jgi:hypothetical protein
MLTKLSTLVITAGVASNPGTPATHDCPPPAPPHNGGGGSSGSGGNCHIVPIVTGYNPDGTLQISGFAVVCS